MNDTVKATSSHAKHQASDLVKTFAQASMLDAYTIQPITHTAESPKVLAEIYSVCCTGIEQLVLQIRQVVNAQLGADIGHDTHFWLMQFDALVEHSAHNRLLAARLYFTLLSQHLPASLHQQSANDQWNRLGCFLNTAADIKVDNMSISNMPTPPL
jgi:hypothetical protein